MSVSDELIKLGYKISKNSKGYYCIYLGGYRQHKPAWCNKEMAADILDRHKKTG